MFHKIKTVVAIIATAGLAVTIMAQSVPPQTVKDSAIDGRLVINGKKIFISGMNIAWHGFGTDLNDNSTIEEYAFTKYIQDVRKNGGNAVRWWLHNDASYCPKIDADGKVTGLAKNSIKSMRKVLDIAYENGVVVAMCLFSHNLMKADTKANWSDFDIDRNFKLFTNKANMDTYITNGLGTILDSLGNHPAVMCWEVFNEPEGMTTEFGSNWGMTRTIPYADVITFTAKVAVAVHSKTKKMVSTGIHEFNKTSYFPKYTDASLKAAADNNPLAYLDFYMAHWYPEHQGVTTMSPFANNAASWGLNRPVIIGEFPGRSWGPGTNYEPYTQPAGAMTIQAAYDYAYKNGYAGALSWAMTDKNFGSIEESAVGLQYLYDNYNDIKIEDVTIGELTGDLVMKAQITGLPVLSAGWSDLHIAKELNFSGKTNLTFELYIASGSGRNLDINVVVKTGSEYEWTPGPTLKLTDYETGKWVTVTVPVSSFGANVSQVREVVLQYGATGTPYSGTLYIDNVKIDDAVISDFDDAKPWSTYTESEEAGGKSAVSIVTRASVGTTSIGGWVGGGTRYASISAPVVSVKGNILRVQGAIVGVGDKSSNVSLKMVNMRGKVVARFKAFGEAEFSLAKIPAGRYIVETKIAGKRYGAAVIVN